jgi:hypothetical protein
MYALFHALLPCSKYILEVVFCEGVQQPLRFCFDHFNCVKMAASQLYVQSGKRRKVRWVAEDSHVIFGQKLPGEKERVKQSGVLLQQPFLLSPKFGPSLRIFSSRSHETSHQNEHTLDFFFTCLAFSVPLSLHFHWKIVALSQGHNHKSSSCH